ncbi:LRP5_6 [Mytilus coruscus]|uniref:LRP5_6 n=1 Tax=Mytilus coruscus TaxID=42192 RepID=A0A6J8CC95_MYTCO|nr:LRP5_6 [Mytilus coruscus]
MEVQVWLCMCLLIHYTLHASSFHQKLLFSSSTSIMEFDVTRRNVTLLVKDLNSSVQALDYDYENGYVYFPRFLLNDIMRFQYPSKNITLQRVIYTQPYPVGIAIDSPNGHIYWIVDGVNKLSRCNLDGTSVTALTTLRSPWVIRLDVTNRLIYFTEWLVAISKIKFDLTENQMIVNLSIPSTCMDLDLDEGRLYWINYDSDIKSAKFDGSDVQTISSKNLRKGYYGISVLDNNIYYINETELLMIHKRQGSSPIVLYNDTKVIDGLFLFKKSGLLINFCVNRNLLVVHTVNVVYFKLSLWFSQRHQSVGHQESVHAWFSTMTTVSEIFQEDKWWQ